MAVQIQLRRDSAADWTSNDPTLANGEIGFETDTNKIKIGDGSTAWTSLAYFAPGGGAHAILDGSVHSDSVADSVTRGSIIYGNATPKWDELVVGGVDTFLGSDGTDVSYRTAAQVMASLSGEAVAAFSFNSQDLTGIGAIGCGAITGTGVAAFEGASVTVGKASTTTGTIILHDSNSANTITLTVPDISAGSLSFTLPPTDGANTNVLQTDGNGVLTWVAAGGGGAFTTRIDVYRNANQTIANNTWVKVLYDTVDYDTGGDYNAANDRFIAPANGYYIVTAVMSIQNLSIGNNGACAVYKNGTNIGYTSLIAGGGPAVMRFPASRQVYLAQNEYIEIFGFQNTGSNQTLQGGRAYNNFQVHRLS